MSCPKCGKPTVPGASFCMHCGQALAAAPKTNAVPAPRAARPAAPSGVAASAAGGAAAASLPTGVMSPAAFKAQLGVRRKRATIAAVSGLVTLLILAAGVKASGILGVGQKPTSANDLSVRGNDSLSMLRLKGSDDSPMLNAGAKLVSMPDDVLDWLKHLKEVERRKRELNGDEMREAQLAMGQANATDGLMTGDAVKDLTDPDSTTTVPPVVDELQKMTAKFKQQWFDLSTFLKSKPAPPECQPIEEAYDRGLNQLAMTIGDVGNMLNPVLDKAESDPGEAKKEGLEAADNIKNGHTKNVDANFGQADEGVAAICAKYHVAKMFDIDRSGADGSSLETRG